jgi:hypothetical protein
MLAAGRRPNVPSDLRGLESAFIASGVHGEPHVVNDIVRAVAAAMTARLGRSRQRIRAHVVFLTDAEMAEMDRLLKKMGVPEALLNPAPAAPALDVEAETVVDARAARGDASRDPK